MQKPYKPKLAVALKYKQGAGQAPEVVAKGSGLFADRIVEIAKENNVAVQQDSELAQMLHQLEINQEIPEHLYEPVAKILSFLYRVDQRVSGNEFKK